MSAAGWLGNGLPQLLHRNRSESKRRRSAGVWTKPQCRQVHVGFGMSYLDFLAMMSPLSLRHLGRARASRSDNFSDIYVQDDRAGANFGANGTWLTLYRASAITGGITTVSTSATGAVRTLTILEVAGLDPSPVDVKNQAGNTFTGGSCNSAVTTTNANDLVLNFCIDTSGSTNWAAQSPWLGVITTTGAPGPAKEKKCAGIPRSVYSVGLLGAKTEIPGETLKVQLSSSFSCAFARKLSRDRPGCRLTIT